MPKRGKTGDSQEEDVTKRAAATLSAFFQALVRRGETRSNARHWALQCAILFFLDDAELLKPISFRHLLDEDLRKQRMHFGAIGDRLGALHVPSFLLHSPPHFDLTPADVDLLKNAANIDWSRIHPGIFGTIFQGTMLARERHEYGAHDTPARAALDYVIRPSLIDPWQARIRELSTIAELFAAYEDLLHFRVLDPACGSGIFLYEAAKALADLELEIITISKNRFSETVARDLEMQTSNSARRFFGIDKDPVAVELAQMTVFITEKKAHEQTSQDQWNDIRCDDALFCDWPKADLILGNPPFQSKNRMQQEFGPDYVRRLRQQFPDVPGRADYCVYWFRKAHDELDPNGRAGLVGTNTIRQNYSREGGLDHIVKNGGTITEAVSTMVWPGEAIVHVAVVNWIKGELGGSKKLSWQEGDQLDSPWHETRLSQIPASLSAELDVTNAQTLCTNTNSRFCFQGQTHGHEGFLLSPEEARQMIASSEKNREVIFPYLIGDDLLANHRGKPSRWVIDFHSRTQMEAQKYSIPFHRIEERVFPDREKAAQEERIRNEKLEGRANRHHANFLKRWWQLGYVRKELMQQIASISRYVVCSRVTQRPVFDFISSEIHPSDALMVFPFEDDYSFGILQSAMHWAWFTARCSTLTARFRYTSETVFATFPWPQDPTERHCLAVAEASVSLRDLRRKIAHETGMHLRAMYASLESPGLPALSNAHAALDEAVRAAYEMPRHEEMLRFLRDLNRECSEREKNGRSVAGPGLPNDLSREKFVTSDCITAVAP